MVPATNVLSVHDVSNIYKVPLLMLQQQVPGIVMRGLKINR
jgi:CTP synthase (UTP-ammonia lyase)